MQAYSLFLGLAAIAAAQSSSDSTTTTTPTSYTTSSTTSSSILPISPICGVAGYDLANPNAALYDGSGLYGTFSTCKAWCANYQSFAVGNGVCLCYAAPVAGNLNAVPASPNVYYDMSCSQSTDDSSTTTPTTTFTLTSSTSITTSDVTTPVSTTTTTTLYTTNSPSTITSSTTTVYMTTTPTTLVTKTTTTTTTTTTAGSGPTSACFKLKVNNQYVSIAKSLSSNLVTSPSTPSAFYIDRLGYLRVATDNYILMRSFSSLTNWNTGPISRLGLFAITGTKNASAKTLALSNWSNGAAPVWTSSKSTVVQHGTSPGSGWTQATVVYEDVTCPSTARI